MSQLVFAIPNAKTKKLYETFAEASRFKSEMRNRFQAAASHVRVAKDQKTAVAELDKVFAAYGGYGHIPTYLHSIVRPLDEVMSDHRDVCNTARSFHRDAIAYMREYKKRQKAASILEKKLENEPQLKFTPEEILRAFPEHVESCEILSPTQVTIITKPLWAKVNKYDQVKFKLDKGRIPIKPMRIEISNSACGSVKFYPHGHDGYRSGHCDASPHPHIMRGHTACWGDFNGSLVDAWATTDLRLYLDVIFLFLAQVNADGDPAGASWPKMFWNDTQLNRPRLKFGINYETGAPFIDQTLSDLPSNRIKEFRGHTLRFWSPGFKPQAGDVVRRPTGQLYRRIGDSPNEYNHLLEWLLASDDMRDELPRFTLMEDILTDLTPERIEFWMTRLPNLPTPTEVTAEEPVLAAPPKVKRTRKPKTAPAITTASAIPSTTLDVVPPPPPARGDTTDMAALDALLASAAPGTEIVV